jgi:hypothetical protein
MCTLQSQLHLEFDNCISNCEFRNYILGKNFVCHNTAIVNLRILYFVTAMRKKKCKSDEIKISKNAERN